jgi:hypothetical protein
MGKWSLIIGATCGCLLAGLLTMPIASASDSLFGGCDWFPGYGCPPCNFSQPEACDEGVTGPGGSPLDCEGGEMQTCFAGDSGVGNCGPGEEIPCSNPDPESMCNFTYDGVCNGGTNYDYP